MWDYNLFGLKWGSKQKKMVRNIGKDTKKLNNGHFLRNQINARREEKRISPEEKERDKERNGSPAICFSCPPLGSKMEFENTTWPNGIRCVNESTLSLSLSPCLCPDLFNCGPSDVLTKLQCCATRVMVIWAPVDTGCFEIPSPCMWKYEINLKFFILL